MNLRMVKIDEVQLMKFCIASLIFYNFWWIKIIGESLIIHWGLFLALLFLYIRHFGIKIYGYDHSKESALLLLFIVIVSFTSMLVATSYSNAFKSIFDMLEYAVLFCIIVTISNKTKSIQWILMIVIVVCLTCAITALIQNLSLNSRLILGENGNSNDLGIKMVYAAVCVLLFKRRSKKSVIVTLCLLFFCTYVIMRTGSRKSLICALFIIITWAIICVPTILKSKYRSAVLIVFPLFLGIVVVLLFVFAPDFFKSRVYERFLFFDEGVNSRVSLYQEAWDMFVENPLIGVGINNFRNHSLTGYYSHSTFAETISCTGIVGSILFLTFFLKYYKDFFVIVFRKSKVSSDVKGVLFIVLVVVLFFSLSVIIYYDLASMLMLSIICCIINNIKSVGGLNEWGEV